MTRKPYILYIEDERRAIDLVREALRPHGYEVTGAISGEEGLRQLRERIPDLILLDLMMPDTNGFDVYRVLKDTSSLAEIPVIVITARIPKSGRIIINGLPPVDDYITKPFKLDRLIRSVRGFLKE